MGNPEEPDVGVGSLVAVLSDEHAGDPQVLATGETDTVHDHDAAFGTVEAVLDRVTHGGLVALDGEIKIGQLNGEAFAVALAVLLDDVASCSVVWVENPSFK